MIVLSGGRRDRPDTNRTNSVCNSGVKPSNTYMPFPQDISSSNDSLIFLNKKGYLPE